MPPKGKDKGGAKGKAGAQLKDILPPNAKQPREGVTLEPIEEPTEEGVQNEERHYEYLPYHDYPSWPGNEEVQALHDTEKQEIIDTVQNHLGEDGNVSCEEDNIQVPDDKLFYDDHQFYVPPSFHEFERRKIKWKRP